MVATWWTQFKTMIWKTVLLKRRNKSKTFAEFFLPVMYVAILAVIKRTAQLNPLEPFGGFPEYSIFNGSILSSSFPDNHPLRILVTPNNSQVRDIMSEFSKIFTDITKKNVSVEIFLNDTIAEEEFQANGSSVLAGIVFNFNGKGSLSYALRFPTSSLPSVQYSDLFASQSSCRKKIGDTQVNDDGLQHNDNCQVNKYMFTGFVQLQATIDAALMKVLYGISYLANEVAVQMLPKPAFQTDTNYIQVISSMYFVLAYLPLISYFTVALVAEKEKKITEGMKMMGLKSSVFWTSTFCVYMFTAIVITGIVTIIAVVADFLPNSSYGLFFILLVFYGISMISLACMLAPFFNKAMMAGVAASMGTMIVSCLYLAVSLTRTYEEGTGSVSYKIPVYGRWLLCLLSPVCLALGMDQAIYMDITGGLNLTSARKGDFPFIGPLFMLPVDSMIYFLLAVYFDNVIPGEYGPKYHPLYIFSPSYWCPPKRRGLFVTFNNDAVEYGEEHPGESTSADIEPVPENMKEKAAVRISGLTKMYKSTDKKKGEVKAINNLSLTIYEDQITAILGHNGAGKTTLMNILTGMTGATSGSATIKGLVCLYGDRSLCVFIAGSVETKDVTRTSDIETLRSMTGVCPQHNILFDQFTCYEHLRLFAGLKGGNISEAEIEEALAVVDLKEQRDVLSTKLSGGQKRKLSVAIAIIGDPKIIFLDEPTAGMDPFSRRSLWEVLKNKKKGRIILLTTHFMDEADILSDRKAIINKGSLRCCGSSFYLKNKFGIGYHLNMVVEPDCDTDKVSYMVQEVVEGSEVNRVHGRELDITLPQAGVNKFAELFSKLEHPATAKKLGVKNFGVSMTTLEEVFLKLEEDVNDLELEQTAGDIDTSTLLPPVVQIQKYGSATYVDMTSRSNPSDTVDCVTGKTLAWQRFRGMFTVVAKTHLRSPLANIFHIVMPVAFVIVGIVLSKNLKTSFGPGTQQLSSLPMSPAYYVKMAGAANQIFPYKTVPKLLLRDTVNSTLTSTVSSVMSAMFETDSNLTTDYFTNMFKLLESGVSPHYIGAQINQLNISGNPAAVTSAFKIFYNDSAVSSIPVMMNLYSNILLSTARGIMGKTDNQSIEVSSYPWPDFDKKKLYDGGQFASILLIGMAFVFIPGGLAIDIVKLRQHKVRSQVRVSGLPFYLYWGGLLAVHAIKFFIPAILTIIFALALQAETLKTPGAMVSFILVCLLFVPANILFTYVLSFIFTNWETASSLMPMLITMAGYFPYIPVSVIDMVVDPQISTILHYVFCVLDPPYLIFGGLYYIDKIYRTAIQDGAVGDVTFGDYFAMSSNIPICFIMPVIHAFFAFFLLRVLDIKSTGGDVREACYHGNRVANRPMENLDVPEDEDEDVSAERSRVRELLRQGHQIPVSVVENLRRQFTKGAKGNCLKKKSKEETTKVAVRNQTFAVEVGEVFGLLGPNGAGKTTTLNMMTADVAPTAGEVLVSGYNIRSEISEAFQMMGYCAQHDALIESITLKEHLEFYARVRGIPAGKMDEIVDFFINNLKLKEHEKKPVEKLSGGTKRKLSYCISMLGRPRIVLLDEPSTGMDPQSKRFLWDTISNSFENSTERGAILTTHYMEEADALCSKIAIMVNGKMECIGSSQHLKTKYGSGYLLEIKLQTHGDADVSQGIERLHGYIQTLFPMATIAEQFSERVQYKVPKSEVQSLAKIFDALEKGKTDYDIAEYSFSQSTLEQVFLEFAKHQLDENASNDMKGNHLVPNLGLTSINSITEKNGVRIKDTPVTSIRL